MGGHIRIQGPLLRSLHLQHLGASSVGSRNPLLLRDVDLGAYLRHRLTV